MLYIKSYFKKELHQTNVENDLRGMRKMAYALFLGLFSFAVYFLLQSLSKSVLTDLFPSIMQQSYFSTLSLFNAMAFWGFLLYFLLYYNDMSFAEIRRNIWYMLLKMGYRPYPMILSKIVALILSVAFVYSMGFIFTAVLTVFLKYNFIFGYFPSLFLTGFVDILLIGIAFMAISLFAKNTATGRCLLVAWVAIQILFRQLSGFRAIVINRIVMQDIFEPLNFHKSPYLPAAFVLILVGIVVCLMRAKLLSQYYNVPSDTFGYTLPKGMAVVRLMGQEKRPVPLNIGGSVRRSRILNATAIALLSILVVVSLAFNLFIILLTTSQPGSEAVIGGKIPYIFKSNTMEPAIMENDLAFFQKINADATVNIGDIVLFMDKSTVFVERVTGIVGDSLEVDIDYYPPMAQTGAMKKAIDRSAIYGVFVKANRYLGAMILFANTLFGRLVLLVLPALLLFFHTPIKAFLERRRIPIEKK